MKKGLLIHPEELSEKWIDRLADAGIDTLGIHPKGGVKSHLHVAEMMETVKTAEFRSLIDYAHKRGLKVEYELHAASYLMPRRFFDAHPEYFRMNEEGVRTPDLNFCVSNKEGMSLVTKIAKRLALSLYGSEPVFCFWMDDVKNSRCHCPECRKYSASQQQLIAVNTILEGIKKCIPEARMPYLAYMDTLECPQNMLPLYGVFLEYAPMCKYVSDAEDAIEREREALLPLLEYFSKEDARVLEYWYDNSMYSAWQKPPKRLVPDAERIRREALEYCKLGFDRISSFACFLGEDYEQLYGEIDISAFAEAGK